MDNATGFASANPYGPKNHRDSDFCTQSVIVIAPTTAPRARSPRAGTASPVSVAMNSASDLAAAHRQLHLASHGVGGEGGEADHAASEIRSARSPTTWAQSTGISVARVEQDSTYSRRASGEANVSSPMSRRSRVAMRSACSAMESR